MPDPMSKEKRAELRKLAENYIATRDSAGSFPPVASLYSVYCDHTRPAVVLSLLDTLDAAEAEAGRLRKVVKRYKKAAEKVMPELSAMYNQLTGERLMRADPQHAVLIAYKMLEAARAAQGTSDAGKA